MAHQIETNGSEAAAIFARTDPWHRLGTTVRGRAFTAEEAMTIGHLGGWRITGRASHGCLQRLSAPHGRRRQ